MGIISFELKVFVVTSTWLASRKDDHPHKAPPLPTPARSTAEKISGVSKATKISSGWAALVRPKDSEAVGGGGSAR